MSKTLDRSKALVLFSGGQDSTVCLAYALSMYKKVHTIGFDYGQRHNIELLCRDQILGLIERTPAWKEKLGGDLVLELPFLAKLSTSALTSVKKIEWNEDELPNTFVPGRNLLFFTAAAAYAYEQGISVLIGGMSEADYSGYPDCREKTLKTLESALNLGMETAFRIVCPLMHKDKASIWRTAEELGGKEFFEIVRRRTHTCYLNERIDLHEWGYGCGDCPACVLRKNGYDAYQNAKKS